LYILYLLFVCFPWEMTNRKYERKYTSNVNKHSRHGARNLTKKALERETKRARRRNLTAHSSLVIAYFLFLLFGSTLIIISFNLPPYFTKMNLHPNIMTHEEYLKVKRQVIPINVASFWVSMR
jgi:hypothetical protein